MSHARGLDSESHLCLNGGMTKTHTIKTRSKAPYALVRVPREGEPRLLGYAYSKSERVVARAHRLGARILPIVGGRVEIEVTR